MIVSAPIATDQGHYYARDGRPTYSIVGKNGKERPTTIRDARAMLLVPSVTEILKVAAKPALDVWKQRQVMLAAMTLPRLQDESDEAFCNRIMEDSKEQGRKAADRGSALHGSLELAVQGKFIPDEHRQHVMNTFQALSAIGIDAMRGSPERSFAHPLGYGGKCDLHFAHEVEQDWVLDFKSKDLIEDGKKLAWPEHLMQLVSYGRGFRLRKPRLLNVFVGVSDAKVHIHEWTDEEEAETAWEQFQCLLRYWKLSKGYESGFQREAA